MRGVKLALGASVYDPADPMGKMFFNILATFAEFEADLIRMRTRKGMAVARAKGKLRGKKPKLSDKQQNELCRMYDTGDYSIKRSRGNLFGIEANGLPNPQPGPALAKKIVDSLFRAFEYIADVVFHCNCDLLTIDYTNVYFISDNHKKPHAVEPGPAAGWRPGDCG